MDWICADDFFHFPGRLAALYISIPQASTQTCFGLMVVTHALHKRGKRNV